MKLRGVPEVVHRQLARPGALTVTIIMPLIFGLLVVFPPIVNEGGIWLSAPWIGIGDDKTVSTSTEKMPNGKVIKTVTTEKSEPGKTLWDFLSVAIIPTSLVILGFWFQQQQQKRAEEKSAFDKEIADSNQREDALEKYFDRLSELLVDQKLLSLVDSGRYTALEKVSKSLDIAGDAAVLNAALNIIRARTLSILRRLGKDGERKGTVIRFLIDAEIVGKLKLYQFLKVRLQMV